MFRVILNYILKFVVCSRFGFASKKIVSSLIQNCFESEKNIPIFWLKP